mgnify:CR=1 FL=1
MNSHVDISQPNSRNAISSKSALSLYLFEDDDFESDPFKNSAWIFLRDTGLPHLPGWSQMELLRRTTAHLKTSLSSSEHPSGNYKGCFEDEDDVSEFDRGADADHVAAQAISRYFDLLSVTQSNLMDHFEQDEMTLLLDALNSEFHSFSSDRRLVGSVADAVGIGGQAQYEVLPKETTTYRLMSKLMKLTLLEEAAVVDACEQFWRRRCMPIVSDFPIP